MGEISRSVETSQQTIKPSYSWPEEDDRWKPSWQLDHNCESSPYSPPAPIDLHVALGNANHLSRVREQPAFLLFNDCLFVVDSQQNTVALAGQDALNPARKNREQLIQQCWQEVQNGWEPARPLEPKGFERIKQAALDFFDSLKR